MATNSAFLPAGQWLFVHDLAACADGTASGAVALARQTGARGLLVKWSDGGRRYTAGGAEALLAACQAAGLDCSAWSYVYPGDGADVAALVQQWMTLSGDTAFLLDAETEFEAPNGAQAAQDLLAAVRQVCQRPWYTSLPWPDQQGSFPWAAFQAACVAFAPQVYFGALAGSGGPTSGDWANVCWNRAAIGPAAGGPTYTAGGPAGWEALSPVLPVVPIFDLSNIGRAADLARNAGFPAVIWWLLDGMTEQQAATLAATPYARTSPAPVRPAPSVDLAAVSAGLAQAEAGIAAARQAAGL